MNRSEFVSQMERLRARFGEKAYDQEFAHILLRDIKDSPDGAFSAAADEIISEYFPGRPPGKDRIVELVQQESVKIRNRERQERDRRVGVSVVRQVSPWPPHIEGLMLCMEQSAAGDREFPRAALSLTGLAFDEAEYLFECFKKRDFDNEWAKELVQKSKSKIGGGNAA